MPIMGRPTYLFTSRVAAGLPPLADPPVMLFPKPLLEESDDEPRIGKCVRVPVNEAGLASVTLRMWVTTKLTRMMLRQWCWQAWTWVTRQAWKGCRPWTSQLYKPCFSNGPKAK